MTDPLTPQEEPEAADPLLLELAPYDVAHGGYCVARSDGRVVFVAGTAPGELVRAQVTARRSRQWYASTVEVERASADRIAPVWPLAARTGVGGADLGHIGLAAGRAWKAAVVAAQLRRIAHLEWPVTVTSAPDDDQRAGLAWRTRLAVVADADGRLAMYAARSHRLVAIDGFPLAVEAIQDRLSRDLTRSWPPGLRRRYVWTAGSGLLTVDQVPGGPAPRSRLVDEDVVSASGHWRYQVGVDGFWQVHRQAPVVLVEAVLAAVGRRTGPIYDLYAGAGLFSLPLAERGPVISVEQSPSAVTALRANTAGLAVTVRPGDVTAVLAGLPSTTGGVIVADPPRSGAGQAAIDQMVRLRPDKLVYVACDPAALARDTGWLAAQGYGLVGLEAFDLFPYTHHVECLALFEPSA